jgi:tetratricopeptide (TPR) repeat protein
LGFIRNFTNFLAEPDTVRAFAHRDGTSLPTPPGSSTHHSIRQRIHTARAMPCSRFSRPTMPHEFNVLLTATSCEYSTLVNILHDQALLPMRETCRDQGIGFRHDTLSTSTAKALLTIPMPIFCVVGNIAAHGNGKADEEDAGGMLHGEGKDRSKEIERHLATHVGADHVYFYLMADTRSSPRRRDGKGSNGELLEQLRRVVPAGRHSVSDGICSDHDLAARIYNDLTVAFQQYRAEIGCAEGTEGMREMHASFRASYALGYRRIRELHDALDDHLGRSRTPVIIAGRRAIGKSTFLANWGSEYQKTHPDAIVITHFIEADGEGASHDRLMRHILTELTLRGARSQTLPTSPDMEEEFQQCFTASYDRHVVLIIDGLDQLGAASQTLQWLPKTPASTNLSLVLSAAPGTACGSAIENGWRMIEVTTKPPEISDAIIQDSLRYAAGRTTDSEVTSDRGASMPTPGAYDEEALLKATKLKTKEAFNDFLVSGLRSPQAREILTSLWGSRRGLTADEITGMLPSSSDGSGDPREDIGHLVARRGGMIVLKHRGLREAIERTLLRGKKARVDIHMKLAAYFSDHPSLQRRAEELPRQLFLSGNLASLRACIEDLDLFSTLIALGYEHELGEYWRSLADNATMAEVYRARLDIWIGSNGISASNIRQVLTMLEALARFFNARGMYRDARTILEQAIEHHDSHMASDTIGQARLRAVLGEILRRAGLYPHAIKRLEEAYALLLATPARDSGLMAQVENDLGLALAEAGDIRALDHIREALRRKIRLLGWEHPSTAESLNDMGFACLQTGSPRAAIMLCQWAIEIQSGHDPNHIAIATYLNNLAAAHNKLGRTATAMTLYHQALEIHWQFLYEDHPAILTTLANIAAIHLLRGDHEAARELSLATKEKLLLVLERDHPHYLMSCINLARVLSKLGEHEAARDLLERTLGACMRTLGTDNRITATCLTNLAAALARLGYYEEARACFLRAIASWRALAEPHDLTIAGIHGQLAEVLQKLGLPEEAVDKLREAWHIREVRQGRNAPATLAVHYRLAVLLDETRPEGDAETCEAMMLYIERHPDPTDATVRDIIAHAERRGCC